MFALLHLESMSSATANRELSSPSLAAVQTASDVGDDDYYDRVGVGL